MMLVLLLIISLLSIIAQSSNCSPSIPVAPSLTGAECYCGPGYVIDKSPSTIIPEENQNTVHDCGPIEPWRWDTRYETDTVVQYHAEVFKSKGVSQADRPVRQ